MWGWLVWGRTMTYRIVLVDDNQNFVATVTQFLADFSDFEVVATSNDSVAAVALLQKLQPDLVLMDISMPTMNGFEVMAQLQKCNQAPKVVFLSMHDSIFYRDAARDIGASGFVSKADFVHELLPAIDRLISAAPSAS